MLLNEIIGYTELPSRLHEDNTGAIHMLKNQTSGPRTKHIDIAYRFANSFIEDGSLEAKYIRSADNPADIMTKNVVEILGSKHSNSIYEGLLVKSTSNEEDDKNRVLLASGLKSVTVVRPTGTRTNQM